MIKNVGLDRFVGSPSDVRAENINFDGQAVLTGSQLANQERHLLTHHRVVRQVGLNVGSKGPDVGHSPAVGQA